MTRLRLLAAAALVIGAGAGCAQENDRPAPETPATTATSIETGTVDPEATPAQDVVDGFYTALGQRDCFTMRTLAALSYQQDDDYWADGCIDELQETVGDAFAYTVLDGRVDGQEAVFHVQRDLPDGTTAADEVVLIDVAGWQVESRSPYDG